MLQNLRKTEFLRPPSRFEELKSRLVWIFVVVLGCNCLKTKAPERNKFNTWEWILPVHYHAMVSVGVGRDFELNTVDGKMLRLDHPAKILTNRLAWLVHLYQLSLMVLTHKWSARSCFLNGCRIRNLDCQMLSMFSIKVFSVTKNRRSWIFYKCLGIHGFRNSKNQII